MPGQHRPRVVARGRARHPRDGVDEGLRGERDRAVAAWRRQVREVLVAQRAQPERRRVGDDLDVLLGRAQRERHLGARQRADDVEQQAGRQDDVPGRLHLCGQRQAQADLHVGGPQLAAVVAGVQLNAGERLHGAARGGDASGGLQFLEESGG